MAPETDDIKVEDLHIELRDASNVPKSFKKIKSLADKLLEKVNGRINTERDSIRNNISLYENNMQNNIDKFINNTNSNLEAFKKRYNAIYGDLVSRVMVKMEQRIFSAEIFEQASLDLLVGKIYRIEKGLSPSAELDHIDYQAYIEDCAEKHEGFMQKLANDFANKQKEERDVAIQEENNSEDSNGDKNKSRDNSDSKDGGTSDKINDRETKQTPVEE